ncbi:MAG TPA: formylglycine-generating enzyme family protein [Nitrospiria bacterium]|nr:formylglycine-generating enzyme family protein [Nitrospiria bacterium]
MRRIGLRAIFALVVIGITFGLFFPGSHGEGLPKGIDQRSDCRTCHRGPYRHQIDDTKDPWCANCHAIHGIGETLGLSRVRRTEGKGGLDHIIEQRMIQIPAGSFIMGDDHFKKTAGPRHTVTLPAYEIDEFDVTNAQYRTFIAASGHPSPPYWIGQNYPPGKANHPVTFVTWFDANAYCQWVGKRLPSEAEWEKAARGTDGRVYPWGDKQEVKRANVPPLGLGDTTPVDAFKGGRSPYGLYDMSGNVFQWTNDWFLPYPGNTTPHPNYGEKLKVLRGGSFYDCSYYRCGISFQTYNRIALSPTTRAISAGFRCAKTIN